MIYDFTEEDFNRFISEISELNSTSLEDAGHIVGRIGDTPYLNEAGQAIVTMKDGSIRIVILPADDPLKRP